MTKVSMALADLAEKEPDADLLRQTIQFVAQRLMEMDIETLCEAGDGERSADRANSRNRYRERVWETCVFRPIVTGDFGIVTAPFGRS